MDFLKPFIRIITVAPDLGCEKLLCMNWLSLKLEDLKAQLAESEHRRLELEAQLRTAGSYQQQVCHILGFNYLFFSFYVFYVTIKSVL